MTKVTIFKLQQNGGVMIQESLKLTVPIVPPIDQTRTNVFGTNIAVRCFGKGFPWTKQHYEKWANGAEILIPYLDFYGIGEALVPDLRGRNAYISGEDEHELLSMHHKPHRLWRTARMVDGIMLRPKRSAFALSADCHIALLVDTLNKKAMVLHCGRDALQPISRSGSRRLGETSVIDTAMRRLMPTSPREVFVLILCGIGPSSYENRADWDKTGFHKAVVDYFVNTCGRGVVQGPIEEGRLNIPLIIRTQLSRWGVGIDDPRSIVWDGVDTYNERSGYYSRRRGSEGNNCVLVDMESAFQ